MTRLTDLFNDNDNIENHRKADEATVLTFFLLLSGRHHYTDDRCHGDR